MVQLAIWQAVAVAFPEGAKELKEYDFRLGSENVVAKVGSVAGVVLARVLDLGPVTLFYFGRFGSIIFFRGVCARCL